MLRAAVVGGEEDERVVCESQAIEAGEQLTDAVIEIVETGCVKRGAVLRAFRFRLELRECSGFRFESGVDGVMREVDEERTVFILFDEVAGGARHRVETFGILRLIALLIGIGTRVVADVEALRFRLAAAFVAEMPLAEMRGRISGIAQRFGHGDLLWRKFLRVGDRNHAHQLARSTKSAVDGVDAVARRVLARHQARAARRAIGSGGVGVTKHHALRGEFIDVRGFVEVAALIADVAPAEVIREDEEDVRRPPLLL